jgi:hypothetical protein
MSISHHLDLYRYWLSKRASLTMPARSDINPADIPALLPYRMLVGKVDDRFARGSRVRWHSIARAGTTD